MSADKENLATFFLICIHLFIFLVFALAKILSAVLSRNGESVHCGLGPGFRENTLFFPTQKDAGLDLGCTILKYDLSMSSEVL